MGTCGYIQLIGFSSGNAAVVQCCGSNVCAEETLGHIPYHVAVLNTYIAVFAEGRCYLTVYEVVVAHVRIVFAVAVVSAVDVADQVVGTGGSAATAAAAAGAAAVGPCADKIVTVFIGLIKRIPACYSAVVVNVNSLSSAFCLTVVEDEECAVGGNVITVVGSAESVVTERCHRNAGPCSIFAVGTVYIDVSLSPTLVVGELDCSGVADGIVAAAGPEVNFPFAFAILHGGIPTYCRAAVRNVNGLLAAFINTGTVVED